MASLNRGESETLVAQPHVLLNDSFVLHGKQHQVTLTKTTVAWEETNKHKSVEECVPLNEVILAEPCEVPTEGCCSRTFVCPRWRKKVLFPEPQPLHINAFKIHFVDRACKHRWKVRTLVFCHDDHNVVRLWITSIRDILKGFQHRPRRLVVFINPFGGKKKAPHIYDRNVRPLFELAQIDVDVVITERANHARDMLQEMSFAKLDGIVCVGGDGMFSELLNGVLRRTQKDMGVQYNNAQTTLMRPRIRLGVIPGGSTDAMAYCTSGTDDPVTAALHVVLGDSLGLDVSSVYQDGKLIQFSTTLLAYGFFGDALKESEKHRWMGPKRYDWSGFKSLCCLKAYEGEVEFRCLPPAGSSPMDCKRCCTGCRVCETAPALLMEHQGVHDGVGWQAVRGRFVALNNATTSCACARARKGISPTVHLGDGCMDLILVEKCSRWNYLRYMLATARKNGNPFNLRFVKVHRVREFQFRPRSVAAIDNGSTETAAPNSIQEQVNFPRARRCSVWNCDGEIISDPAISVRVHCQLVRIFSRGVEDFPSSLVCQEDYQNGDAATRY